MFKVIYHANCPDGFCGAYLFYKYFKQGPVPSEQIQFIPMHYGVELDLSRFTRDDIVYLVDFSFKRGTMLNLAEMVKEVWVLDHHKTAYDDLTGLASSLVPNIHIYFDMDRSGAQLAYDFLSIGAHQSVIPRAPVYPNLVNYVADRDLWQFALYKSQEVNMFIRSFKFTFEDWMDVEDKVVNDFAGCIEAGAAILRYQRQEIDQAVKHARLYYMRVPSDGSLKFMMGVNSTVNFSEVAGELAPASPSGIGIAWFQRHDGKFQYSLRSRSDVDCSEVAKAMGGGGHKQAAGFESDTQVLVRAD